MAYFIALPGKRVAVSGDLHAGARDRSIPGIHACAPGVDPAHCGTCGERLESPRGAEASRVAAEATALALVTSALTWQRGQGTEENHAAAARANRAAVEAHEAARAASALRSVLVFEIAAKDHEARVRFHERAAVAARRGVAVPPKGGR